MLDVFVNNPLDDEKPFAQMAIPLEVFEYIYIFNQRTKKLPLIDRLNSYWDDTTFIHPEIQQLTNEIALVMADAQNSNSTDPRIIGVLAELNRVLSCAIEHSAGIEFVAD